jgi:DNA repair protein RadC
MATNKQLLEQVQRTIVSDIKIIYQPKVNPSERPMIRQSEDAYRLFMESWDMTTIYLVEQAKLMLLNRANRVLGIMPLSSGGMCGTVMDPRIIFLAALQAGASSFILAHNHPSSNLKASNNDKILTAKVKEAGTFLDIQLSDHLIIAPEGFYSMADDGLL